MSKAEDLDLPVQLILDSGAYSAWRQKKPIDVHQYIEFIKKHELIHRVVNLDQIPGEYGRVPSPHEVEESAACGYKHLKIMRKAGIDAMPVFHQGERRYWLDKMLDDGYDYIGISPANDRTTKQKEIWLDEIFGYLCGLKGFPSIKTHGFGVTAYPIMYRYPWFSCDSVTWLLIGGYGCIFVPKSSHGAHDYTLAPDVISLSQRIKKGKASAAALDYDKHVDQVGPYTRKYIIDFIEENGFTLQEARDNYLIRQKICARTFVTALQTYEVGAFKGELSFFKETSTRGQTTPVHPHIKKVFSLTTSPEHSGILADEGIRNRLLTYYYFQDAEPFDLDEYIRCGRITDDMLSSKQRKRRQRKKKRADLQRIRL